MSRNRRRKRDYSTVIEQTKFWVILLVLFVISIFFFTGSHGTFQLIKVEMEKKRLHDKKSSLLNELHTLESQKDSLLHNPKTIEKIARENYNMVKPGEKVFQITPEE